MASAASGRPTKLHAGLPRAEERPRRAVLTLKVLKCNARMTQGLPLAPGRFRSMLDQRPCAGAILS